MRNTRKASGNAASGPPRWTYALGAIVGALALGWTIVSHFIPPLEKPAEPAPPTAPTPDINVDVTGERNIGIGQMQGGTIIQGERAGKD